VSAATVCQIQLWHTDRNALAVRPYRAEEEPVRRIVDVTHDLRVDDMRQAHSFFSGPENTGHLQTRDRGRLVACIFQYLLAPRVWNPPYKVVSEWHLDDALFAQAHCPKNLFSCVHYYDVLVLYLTHGLDCFADTEILKNSVPKLRKPYALGSASVSQDASWRQFVQRIL
jgi:hypothetical protein